MSNKNYAQNYILNFPNNPFPDKYLDMSAKK